MTETQINDANWTPTRASTAVVLVGTAGGIAALSSAVGVQTGALVAAGGAVCFAVALHLLTLDRWQIPARLAAGLLLVPAGAGVTVGVGYELLVAFAASFPVDSPGGMVGQGLRIASLLAVLWGCTLAAFGAAASVRGDATARTLTECRGLAVRVALLPVAFGIGLAGHALVTNFDLGAAGMAGELVSGAFDWLFAPTPGQFHSVGVWLLFVAATYATYRAVHDLPLQALAGEASVGEAAIGEASADEESVSEESVSEESVGEGSADETSIGETLVGAVRMADLVGALRLWTGRLFALVALGLPVALLLKVDASAEVVRDVLSPALYQSLVDITASPALRRLLAAVAVVAGALAGVATLVRQSSRISTRAVMAKYTPFLAGLTVVAGVDVVHRPVLKRLLGFIAGRLEPPLSGQFRDISSGVVEFYGSETIVLGLTAGVLTFATLGLVGLSVWFALGFVEDRAAGPALAGAGLFVATGFAGTIGVSLWVLLGGLVLALVVWDTGEFAATLGVEVGRRGESGRVELLHTLTSVGVGGVAAISAAGLVGLTSTEGVGPGAGGELGRLAVALLGAVAAVVLLVLALR